MSKNILMSIDLEDLFESLEKKLNDESKANNIIKSLKKNERFLIDDGEWYLIFKNNDLEELKNILGEDIVKENNINTLYNSGSVMYFEEGNDFGIREYNCFHFHYDEVHDGLEDYFNSEQYTEEIFNSIKEIGLEKLLEKKYKEQVAFMIETRINEIKNLVKNRDIDRW